MAERVKRIPIPGTNYVIDGLLCGADLLDAPIVVFAHCYTGSKDCMDIHLGARALEAAGFTSYRFDFYGYDEAQRDFLDCVLETHVSDLDLVTETFQREYPQRPIAVVGHSIGALVILASKKRAFDAAVLWDPTHRDLWDSSTFEDDPWFHYEWLPNLCLYRSRGGVEHLVSKEYLESYRFLDSDQLISTFDVPIHVVIAGDSSPERSVAVRTRLYERANEPKQVTVIPGADHCFIAGDTMTNLHSVTIDWLRSLGW